MSKRTDNRHRVATICRQATGLPHHMCLRWAADGLITRLLPVPDAASVEQRAFEAQVVHELANGLRDERRDGSLLGFTRAVPGPDGLVLELHPAMGDRVLTQILPRMDEAHGGVRGVPGLRLTPSGGEWLLMRVTGDAVIRLVHPRVDWQPRLPGHGEGLTQLWRRNRHRAHPAEAERMDDWEYLGGDPTRTQARDRLLSRLLRRPLLLGVPGSGHGWANTYTHGGTGLIVEWSCPAAADELEGRLRRSGLAERPRHAEQRGRERERSWFPGEIGMDGAVVTVRHRPCPVCTGHDPVRRAL
nr:hypothetical protein OG409_12105 [Streptomyces sp. NBC_00974]